MLSVNITYLSLVISVVSQWRLHGNALAFEAAFRILPKTGNAEPENWGKPDSEWSRTICACSISGPGDVKAVPTTHVSLPHSLLRERERERWLHSQFPAILILDPLTWTVAEMIKGVWIYKINHWGQPVNSLATRINFFNSFIKAIYATDVHHFECPTCCWTNSTRELMNKIVNTISASVSCPACYFMALLKYVLFLTSTLTTRCMNVLRVKWNI